jgi:hypothetical protein
MAGKAEPDSSFYVYVIFRPDGSPCYVGKGKGNRWRRLRRRRNPRLERIIAKGARELPIIKIREGLTEAQAFEVEVALIAAIGRGKNGPLVNMTDGGDGTSGYKRTPEQLARLQAYWETPEGQARKRRQAVSALEQGCNPKNIARLIEQNKTNHPFLGRRQSPKWRGMIGSIVAGSNSRRTTTARTRDLRRAKMKAMWADPAIRKRLLEGRIKDAADGEHESELRSSCGSATAPKRRGVGHDARELERPS